MLSRRTAPRRAARRPCPRPRGAGADRRGLSQPADPPGRPLCAGHRDRPARAHAHAALLRGARPAHGGGEPGRRRRHRRRRGGGPRHAGRLHARLRRQPDPRHQCRALPLAALQPGDGFRAGRAHRGAAHGAGGESRTAGALGGGTRRAGQGAARPLNFASTGSGTSPSLGRGEAAGADRHRPCPMPHGQVFTELLPAHAAHVYPCQPLKPHIDAGGCGRRPPGGRRLLPDLPTMVESGYPTSS